MDHYQRLNVSQRATQSEIERSYRKLVLTYHPDKGGDYNMFLKIQESYSFLSDRYKREFYDMFGDSLLKNGSLTYMLGRLFTKRNVILYAICFILLFSSLIALPFTIVYGLTLYIIPQIILSQATMTIAVANCLINFTEYPKTRYTIMGAFVILSLSHMLFIFTLMWISGYPNCLYIIITYSVIDFIISLVYYMATSCKYTFTNMGVRIVCVVGGFYVSNTEVKLVIALLHTTLTFLFYLGTKRMVYIIPIMNYIWAIYFTLGFYIPIMFVLTSSVNVLLAVLVIFKAFLSIWRKSEKISPLLRAVSDFKQLKG